MHLRIQVVHFLNRVLNITTLHGFLYRHSIRYGGEVDICCLQIRTEIGMVKLSFRFTDFNQRSRFKKKNELKSEWDTLRAGLRPEFLSCLDVALGDKEIHHQFVHVLLPDLDVVELLLPLLPREHFLRRRLSKKERKVKGKCRLDTLQKPKDPQKSRVIYLKLFERNDKGDGDTSISIFRTHHVSGRGEGVEEEKCKGSQWCVHIHSRFERL